MPTKSNFNQEKFEKLNYLLITLRDLTQNRPILQYGETFAEHVFYKNTCSQVIATKVARMFHIKPIIFFERPLF